MTQKNLIKWFNQISLTDISLVGGKNASLGEMIKNLSKLKIKIPDGFAITTQAYKKFLEQNKLEPEITKILDKINLENLGSLKNSSQKIKDLISKSKFSPDFIASIKSYYVELKNNQQNFRVAVRSSASAEDLPTASFAGQQDTYLHVASFEEVLTRIKDVYSSLFSERAISYRSHQGFDNQDIAISVGIQTMVNSDQGCSGVMFTLDPESGFDKIIFINASYGLGEAVVSGAVNPDEYIMLKNNFKLLNKNLGLKNHKLIYNKNNSQKIISQENTPEQREKFCLDKKDLDILAQNGLAIEKHYGRPMDIEWAKDGETQKIFILQARPETIHSNKKQISNIILNIKTKSPVLVEGRAVGKKIGQGTARVLKNISQAQNFTAGDILVTDMTDPNWEPIMKKASAIVTNRGGRTCHAAIIARELGVPAVVGCHDATKKIKNNQPITVSCAEGDVGKIYENILPIEHKEVFLDKSKKPPVPLMMIAGNPERAFNYYNLPHQGIGLARLEFIIANQIGIHPNAILQINKIPKNIREKIKLKSKNYSDPVEFYISQLTQGMATLATVAEPYPIIIRMSDFKTNEYEELLGGNLFEHKENNPMIGFRGAARYTSEFFKHAFELECQAILRAREEFGFANIQVMIPFVRTVEEAEKIIKLLEKNNISSNKNNLKIIMMCEIPSNVILADSFLDFFDGFSIGSNDLTQLTLGVDRDSHLVAGHFSEHDQAMLKMFEMVINSCKKRNKYIGICGQGPSDNLNLARFLINQGIDSISLTPDSLAEAYNLLGE